MIDQQEIAPEEPRPEDESLSPSPAPLLSGPPKSLLREYFEQGVVTVIMALFLMTFIAQAVQVPTGSMQNNIHIGDHLFVNKFLFGRQTPVIGKLLPAREVRRGDIIVFKYPKDPKVNYVKRVIGLPGEEVQVRGTHVYINGRELPEQHVIIRLQGLDDSAHPEVRVEPAPPGATYQVYYDDREHNFEDLEFDPQGGGNGVGAPVIVPPDSYFAMGDNRDNSQDSRFWGFVPRANITGRALYVYWSFNPRDPIIRAAEPENPGLGRLLLKFFTKTDWRRTGKPIK